MAQGGKTSFPVDPSSLIYSHFEHVSGVAAPEGSQGITISKLNLLDVLIGQLNKVKSPPQTARFNATPSDLNAPRFNKLIENLTSQIRQAKSASTAMPYIPSPSAQSGAVFSLFA
jgi:hypothetical protein